MKHLFRGLFAALCAFVLSLTALADVVPFPYLSKDPVKGYLILALIIVGIVILYLIDRKRNKK